MDARAGKFTQPAQAWLRRGVQTITTIRRADNRRPLAIFEAVVCEHGMKAFEHLHRVGEIEASPRQRLLALGLVEGDLHLIYVPPINPASQDYGGTGMKTYTKSH